MIKTCKECKNEYHLKDDGRYCPKCGRDYWDGAATGIKKLSSEELKVNNRKMKDLKNRKNVLLTMVLMIISTFSFGQIYPDEIQEPDSLNSFLISNLVVGQDTLYAHNVLEIRNDSLCIMNGDGLLKLPRIVKQAEVSFISDDWFLILRDSLGNEIVQTLMYGLIDEIETLSDAGGATTFILQTGGILNELKYRDGVGVDVYVDTGEEIKFRVDTTVVATQYDLTQNTFDSTHIYQALADSMSLAIDRDTLNEGQLSFITAGGGVYRIESNTAGGATPFFNDSSMPSGWTWNISGNAIGITAPSYLESYTEVQDLQDVTDLGATTSNAVTINNRLDLDWGTDNVVIGRLSMPTLGGYQNTILGHNNGTSLNGGVRNTVIGSYTMNSATTAGNNVFVGFALGDNITTGTYNTAMQYRAFKYQNGDFNVAIGREAMEGSGTAGTGDYNTFIGYQAGHSMNNGSNNVGVGRNAGAGTTDGTGNSYIGQNAGLANTGSNNLAIGSNALAAANTGSGNVVIGESAGRTANTNNSIFIGKSAGYYETNDERLYIDNTSTLVPLLYGEFDNDLIKVNGKLEVTNNLDVTGKVTVGDNVEGNAVNIAGYDSDNDLTRVSIGANLTLSSGTLSADDQTPIQTLGSARMDAIDYDTGDYPSYENVSIATVNDDNGDVTVSTTNERMEIDSDGGARYMVTITGHVSCDTGSDEVIEFYMNTGSYDWVGTVYVKDTDTQSFHVSFPITFSNNDNVILSIKPPSAPSNNITLGSIDWTIIKI